MPPTAKDRHNLVQVQTLGERDAFKTLLLEVHFLIVKNVYHEQNGASAPPPNRPKGAKTSLNPEKGANNPSTCLHH